MTLRDALKIMKQQAAEMAIKAQNQAEQAAWERAEADAKYAQAQDELAEGRQRITQLEVG